jgi:hypothetical protein
MPSTYQEVLQKKIGAGDTRNMDDIRGGEKLTS